MAAWSCAPGWPPNVAPRAPARRLRARQPPCPARLPTDCRSAPPIVFRLPISCLSSAPRGSSPWRRSLAPGLAFRSAKPSFDCRPPVCDAVSAGVFKARVRRVFRQEIGGRFAAAQTPRKNQQNCPIDVVCRQTIWIYFVWLVRFRARSQTFVGRDAI